MTWDQWWSLYWHTQYEYWQLFVHGGYIFMLMCFAVVAAIWTCGKR